MSEPQLPEKVLSNDEIVDALLVKYHVKNDNQLAKLFDVERQQVKQFRAASRIGITQKIISILLVDE